MKRLVTLAALASLAFTQPVFAGSQEESPRKFEAEDIVHFAKQTEQYLADHGAYVAIIARVGRDPDSLPAGIAFTHTAIAVYSDITMDDGSVEKGYAIHNLYQLADKPGTSMLKTDYPVDFFWGVSELKAGIVIPTPVMQQKLLAVFANGDDKKLHDPRYSVVANPFTEGRQNCTEYTLDIVNSAIYGTTDMARLKVNTKAWYEAQPVKVSKAKLRLGSIFSSGVSLSDHEGAVETATFTTINRYLQQNQLVQDQTILYANNTIQE